MSKGIYWELKVRELPEEESGRKDLVGKKSARVACGERVVEGTYWVTKKA